jgi:type I restriction enzyme S subunit
LIKLTQILKIKHGFPFKGEKMSEVLTGKPIVVNIGNYSYTGGFRFFSTRTRQYEDSYPKEYELKPGSILLAMTCQTAGGEILGIPAKVPNDKYTYLHNQRLGLVEFIENSSVEYYKDYIYWIFLSKEFNSYLFNTATGTKILHTSPQRIESFEFELPSIQYQQKIAKVLNSIDEKISTNNHINETLEAMAKAIFKEWFIDFGPVKAKAECKKPFGMDDETAALFPDSFEDSKLGQIPKGWEVRSFGDISNCFDSKRIPLSGAEREKRKGIYPYYGAASHMGNVDDFIFDGIYVLMGEDGSVVNKDGSPILQYVWDKFWVNNHAHVLTGKGISTEHLFLFLKHIIISPYITGAVQPKLNQGNMNRIPFVNAPPVINIAFASLIEPLYEKIRANKNENDLLVQTRDLLLPKLISGEISFEKFHTVSEVR